MAAAEKNPDSLSAALSDQSLPGMVHIATVRAPISCGLIKTLTAPALPPGYRLILPADIPGQNHIVSFGTEVPILAASRVSYRGEPVALVVGPEALVAAELARSTVVDCEEEEGAFGWESFSSGQVLAKRVVVVGDPDMAFSISDRTVEGTWRSGASEHLYSEPQGAMAGFDYDKLAVWCGTQWPYHVRDSVALALGCKEDDVVVRPTRLGVHMDGKLWYPSLVSCHAALAAWILRKPARILLTREEDFLYTPKRARSSITLRTALDATGRLSAVDARVAVNVGAYGPLARETLSQICLAATGVYACPNVRVEGYAVTTNDLPLGSFGGLGASHAFFAAEATSALLAQATGEDPIDWKARNILKKGSLLITGEALKEEPPYEAMAERLAAASDFRRKYACYELVRKRRSGRADGPLRGIGFAFAYQGAGSFIAGDSPNAYAVEVTLEKDLRITIKTSAAACKPSVRAIWKRSAALLLDIPLEDVSVAPPDTDRAPNSGPTTLSRGITVINRLVEKACESIQKKRFRDPLPLTARSVYRAPRPIRWEEGRVVGSPFETASWGGAIVEVELDPWTLEPLPLGIWLCVDGGLIVSRTRAEESLRAGTVDAIGLCTRERLDIALGSISEDDYYSYGLMSLAELPPIHIDLFEPDRRVRSKGIGELPFDTVPPAFLAAVTQAAGTAFYDLPVRPEDLSIVAEET
jgi:CO/xanthine dehydrogenase Mo-binding subunit